MPLPFLFQLEHDGPVGALGQFVARAPLVLNRHKSGLWSPTSGISAERHTASAAATSDQTPIYQTLT
jgi:hypothetical protein